MYILIKSYRIINKATHLSVPLLITCFAIYVHFPFLTNIFCFATLKFSYGSIFLIRLLTLASFKFNQPNNELFIHAITAMLIVCFLVLLFNICLDRLLFNFNFAISIKPIFSMLCQFNNHFKFQYLQMIKLFQDFRSDSYQSKHHFTLV